MHILATIILFYRGDTQDLLSVLPQKFSNFFSSPLFTLCAERFCFSDMNLISSLPVNFISFSPLFDLLRFKCYGPVDLKMERIYW